MQYTVGVDVGRAEIRYGLFDEEKNIKARRTSEADLSHSPGEFFDAVVKNIEALLQEAGADMAELSGVGLGMSAFLRFGEGRLIKAINHPKLQNFALKEYLCSKFAGANIIIDHRAQAAALAEYRYGAGRGLTDMLYCPLGSTLCAGIILGGKIYRGSHGLAGQTGHMIITPDEGQDCLCGNKGCFMSWSSGDMIVAHVKRWLDQGETSMMTDLAGRLGTITPEHISVAYERGDAMAEKAISQMSKYIGIWMYNMYLNFNIETFVIGGGLMKMGKKLAGPIRKSFDMYNHCKFPVVFKTAELKQDQGIIGANELLFE